MFCHNLQAGGTVTAGLLDQAADPQRWLKAYGAPLSAPRLQAFNTAQVNSIQAPSQPHAVPPPQQQQQWVGSSAGGSANSLDQQWSEASVDAFAAFPSPSSMSRSSQSASAQQQPQLLQQQLNPFDESSQPFMPRQAAVLQAGSFSDGNHPYPDLIPDLYPQPPLGSGMSQDPAFQVSPLDDMLQPLPHIQVQTQPQQPQHALQHTQSMPKLLPRPKSALKRYTDVPSHGSGSHSYQPSNAGSATTFDSFTTTSSAPSALPVLANPFAQSAFGDMSLARPSAPMLRVQKADMSPSGSPSGSPTKGDLRGQPEAPLAFDARLPPLHPKLSARLTLLAAAHGSLFAGPSSGGGLLQWARPEGNMRQPKGANAPAE